jgi:hypothetical protein
MMSLSRPRFVARLLSQRQCVAAAARPGRYRLTLETLEDRLVLDGTGTPPPPPPPPPPSQNGPVANNDAAAYYFDHAAPIIGDIYANDTDPNAGASIVPGSVSIVTPPRYGTALPDPTTGQILYTPNTIPASQVDTFQYQVRDTLNLVSNIATVTITPVGARSVTLDIEPQSDLINTATLKPVSFSPTANDIVVDGSAVDLSSVTLVTPPLHGSAVVNPTTGVVTYTPDFGFAGFEHLVYTAKTTKTNHPEPGDIYIAVYPQAPRLQADPLGGTMLVVDGTQGNDIIDIDRGRHGDVMVTVNGVTSGPFQPTSRVVALGYGGDDKITVSHDIKLPTWLAGGDGSDTLVGGGGNNLLLGNAGNDLLVGGGHRDVLIGGSGRDVLAGMGGRDILISGSTSFDTNQTALAAIVNEWTSSASYQQRVADLTDVANSGFGKRLNGNFFLLPTTIQTGDLGNLVVAGPGRNLLFVDDSGSTPDIVIDQHGHGKDHDQLLAGLKDRDDGDGDRAD